MFQALRVHCPPAGTLDGQLLVSEKFQLTPIFRMSSVALPVLVKVTGWLKSPTATKEGSEATFGEVNVSFSPKRIGTLEGAVTIKDNVPSNSQKIPLTGIGTVVTLLPSSLDFVNQQVGITSPPQVQRSQTTGQRRWTFTASALPERIPHPSPRPTIAGRVCQRGEAARSA